MAFPFDGMELRSSSKGEPLIVKTESIDRLWGPLPDMLILLKIKLRKFVDDVERPPRVTDGRRASTAENRMLNTWRSAFKPAY